MAPVGQAGVIVWLEPIGIRRLGGNLQIEAYKFITFFLLTLNMVLNFQRERKLRFTLKHFKEKFIKEHFNMIIIDHSEIMVVVYS